MVGVNDDLFKSFITEVKKIEEKDSVYTSEKQIARLLRPGSSYANLNPFEVLLLAPEATLDEIRKQYKKMSLLLHPDKNPNDRDKAQQAFDVVSKSYKLLEDEKTRSKALEIYEEAKFKVDQMIVEKKKKLKREKRDARVEEDDPEKYKHAIRVMAMKLFADYERKRRDTEVRATDQLKRKREEEIEKEEAEKANEEWTKTYEQSREVRVTSWQSFQTNKKTKRKEFRPPKHKSETR